MNGNAGKGWLQYSHEGFLERAVRTQIWFISERGIKKSDNYVVVWAISGRGRFGRYTSAPICKEILTAFKEVNVYAPPPPCAALFDFNVESVHSSDLANVLDLERVSVRSCHHCAQLLHKELGVSSFARATPYIYNTKEKIEHYRSYERCG